MRNIRQIYFKADDDVCIVRKGIVPNVSYINYIRSYMRICSCIYKIGGLQHDDF